MACYILHKKEVKRRKHKYIFVKCKKKHKKDKPKNNEDWLSLRDKMGRKWGGRDTARNDNSLSIPFCTVLVCESMLMFYIFKK